MQLIDAIQKTQQVGQQHGFTIVVVGGAIVRLIDKKTTIEKVDAKKRMIFLKDAENPGTTRSEDARTTVDIDGIVFSNATDPFTQEVKQGYTYLLKNLHRLRKDTPHFPPISLEPVLYHPYFPKPNQLTQFVSSVESYQANHFFFRLDSVKEDVSQESLDFWTYVLDKDTSVISLNPLAIQRRYAIRGFSVKPKDKEKIWGKTSIFAHFVQDFSQKTNHALEKDFIAWDEFARRIATSNNPSIRSKKALWNAYWQTIGTYLAHGTGIVGKVLLPLGNTFFAGK